MKINNVADGYKSIMNNVRHPYLKYLIKYGIIITIFTIIGSIFVLFSGDERYSFWSWVTIIISYIVFSTPLAALGKYLSVKHGPAGEKLKELDIKWQLFWKYGIQVLGWVVGVIIAGSYILPKLGIYTNRTY